MDDAINKMLYDLMQLMKEQAEAIISLSDRIKLLEEEAAWQKHDDLAPQLRVE